MSDILCCPRCASTQTQRVSAIYQAGAGQSQSIGAGLGAGRLQGGPGFGLAGATLTRTTHSTFLAQSLAPPAAPARRKDHAHLVIAVCLTLAIPLGALATLGLIPPYSAFSGFWAALFGFPALCLGLAAIFLALQAPRSHALAKNEYETALGRYHAHAQLWQALFYCPRCDSVFAPGRADFITSADLPAAWQRLP